MADQPNLDPARTTLLVMDYEVGLVRGLPDAQALIERVDTTTDGVRAGSRRSARDLGLVGGVRIPQVITRGDGLRGPEMPVAQPDSLKVRVRSVPH